MVRIVVAHPRQELANRGDGERVAEASPVKNLASIAVKPHALG
jgi:hypothetical protein